MELLLKSKRALITGSSSGIGEATARLLAREGCVVVVHGRETERVEYVARDIRATGGQAIIAVGDLANDVEAQAVCETVESQLGGVDILFNNVGGGRRVPSRPAWHD